MGARISRLLVIISKVIIMSDTKQNLIHLLTLLLISVFFFLIQPKTIFTPHGILLPSANTKLAPINFHQVRIHNKTPVNNIQNVGFIRVIKHYVSISMINQQIDLADNIDFAKHLASKAGANNVVVKMIGHTPVQGELDGSILYADAIQTH